MIIYLLVFLIVEVLSLLECRLKNKKMKIIIPVAIVTILSILGGARDFTIGTDVTVYGKSWFENACNSQNLVSYLTFMNKEDTGYLILNYIVSRFTNSTHIFLFVLQVICNGLVISTLYKFKDKCPLWLSVLIYITVFYCRTYNILRQSIALSIIFFAIRYLDSNKKFRFFISIIIAAQFHFTAYIGLIVLFLYALSKSNLKYKNVIMIAIVLLSMIFVVCIKDILSLLYQMNIINYRIYSYIFEFSDGNIDINYIETLFKLFFMILAICSYKKIKNDSNMNQMLLLCVIIDFIVYQIRSIIDYADRFSLYFGYFIMLITPQCVNRFGKDKANRLFLNVISSLVLIVFWYYKYVYSGSCEVYPYTSPIIGI